MSQNNIKSKIQFFENEIKLNAGTPIARTTKMEEKKDVESVIKHESVTKREWTKGCEIIASPMENNVDCYECFGVSNNFLAWLFDNEPSFLDSSSVLPWVFEENKSQQFGSHPNLMLTFNGILWSKTTKKSINWNYDQYGNDVWCHPVAIRYIKTDAAKSCKDNKYLIYDSIDEFTTIPIEEGELIIGVKNNNPKPCGYFYVTF